MTWHESRVGRCAQIAAGVVASVPLLVWIEAGAQETAPTDQAASATAVEEAAASDGTADTPPEGALSDDELQALVAPIALYPDLVLVLTLQASLAPLDVVQADRFLSEYAEDPSLEPDPDWDQSVVGLLNYPTVVGRMSGDLDWTQTLGDAVIDHLEGVQDAILEIRGFMRAIGALESNEQMTVIAEGDVSQFTQNVLRLGAIVESAEDDPEAALATLHEAVTAGVAGPNAMFAYAELAFQHASIGGGQPYYLASAIYAFAYLFPEGEGAPPSPFDPRYRWAVELYNLAVAKARRRFIGEPPSDKISYEARLSNPRRPLQ